MKIRQGFVSNSSTTSFCIYGTTLTEKEYEKLNNIIYDEKSFVELQCGECDSWYIGKDWSSIKDEETGRQFKDKIENEVKNLIEKANIIQRKFNFGTHEETWRDG